MDSSINLKSWTNNLNIYNLCNSHGAELDLERGEGLRELPPYRVQYLMQLGLGSDGLTCEPLECSVVAVDASLGWCCMSSAAQHGDVITGKHRCFRVPATCNGQVHEEREIAAEV
jgi:hypothetical protein